MRAGSCSDRWWARTCGLSTWLCCTQTGGRMCNTPWECSGFTLPYFAYWGHLIVCTGLAGSIRCLAGTGSSTPIRWLDTVIRKCRFPLESQAEGAKVCNRTDGAYRTKVNVTWRRSKDVGGGTKWRSATKTELPRWQRQDESRANSARRQRDRCLIAAA